MSLARATPAGSVHIGVASGGRLANRLPINLCYPDVLLTRVVDLPFRLQLFIVKAELQALLKAHHKASQVLNCASAIQSQAPSGVSIVEVRINRRLGHELAD